MLAVRVLSTLLWYRTLRWRRRRHTARRRCHVTIIVATTRRVTYVAIRRGVVIVLIVINTHHQGRNGITRSAIQTVNIATVIQQFVSRRHNAAPLLIIGVIVYCRRQLLPTHVTNTGTSQPLSRYDDAIR